MTREDRHAQQKLVVVATAANEVEADAITLRLQAAGISALAQRTIGGPEFGASGARYVYVQEADEARARDILAPDPLPDGDGEAT
jgi:hypothetical protein